MAASRLSRLIRILLDQWPDKTVVTAAHRATRLFKATTQREHPLSSVKNKRLAAFAGISKPDDFFRTVRDLGADLVHAAALPDHYPLTIELLDFAGAGGVSAETGVVADYRKGLGKATQ